jgi:membrane protein required for colicin V production
MGFMADISLTMFDLGVLIIIGLSALMAFFRGFVREFLSLIGWLGASIITLRTLPLVSKALEPHIGSPVIATGIASVLIFFGALIVFSIISGFIIRVLKPGSKVGLFDNLLGLCFGVARGTLMVAIAYYILGVVLVEKDFPKAIKEAYTRPYIGQVAKWVGTFTPNALNVITDKKPLDGEAIKNSGAKVVKIIEDAPSELPDAYDVKRNTPSIEDLQQRLREENEKR